MKDISNVLEILSKYVDLSYCESHVNGRGIKVDAYFDGRDSRYMYGKELEGLGFERIHNSSYSSDWFCENLLCCVAYCERDLYVVRYKDIKEYKSELKESIEFNK